MENRRQLLKAALTTAPLFIPRHVWGANDHLTYGVIGTGGRGRYLMDKFQKAGAQCVALCDVYEPFLAEAKKTLPAGVKTYSDHHDLLAQKDIDFVIVATPDHQHYPMLLASLAAKKDVYQEKPLSHTLAESAKMIEAVRKSDRIVQVGMQRRSAPIVREAKKLIEEGALGKVSMVKAQFNWKIARPLNNSPLPGKLDWSGFLGGAPQHALEPMRFRQWRFFWDYAGGCMTDLGAHIMDVVQWCCNAGKPPISAVSYGQLNKMEGAETPDVVCAVFQYPTFTATWSLNYCSAFNSRPEIVFQGDAGSMVMTADGFRVYKEPWDKPENQKPIREESGTIEIEPHIENFLECVKSRREPNGTIEAGAAAAAAPQLANVAFRQQKLAKLSES
jgi:predicted dehydrogenase